MSDVVFITDRLLHRAVAKCTE